MLGNQFQAWVGSLAPVLEQGATSRSVHLPAGAEWCDAWTGATHAGGVTLTAAAPPSPASSAASPERTSVAERPENAEHIERLVRLMRQWQNQVGDRLEIPPGNRPPPPVDLTGRPREPDQWQPEWIRKKYF